MKSLLTVDPVFLHNVIMIIAGIVPVSALILYQIPMNGKHWFIFWSMLTVPGSLFYYFYASRIDIIYPPNGLYLTYALFLLVFLYLNGVKNGFENFNKTLGIGLLLTYVSTEFWEVPVFVFAPLKLFGKEYLGPFNQLYFVTVFLTLVMRSKEKPRIWDYMIMVAAVIASGAIIAAFPNMVFSESIWMVNRLLSYFVLGGIFLRLN